MLSVLLVCAWGASLGTQRADAFIGESVVREAGHLTKEARDLIKVPDYIPKIWEGGGGGGPPIEEVNAWTDFFEAGGVLPWLGGVAAFGIGTGIGSYICNEVLELEGCWYYGSKEADPSLGSGEWVFNLSPPGGAPATGPWFAYYWRLKPAAAYSYTFEGTGSVPAGCTGAIAPPAGAGQLFIRGSETSWVCSVGATHVFGYQSVASRTQTTNRTLQGGKGEFNGSHGKYSGSGYCPAVGPGSLACASKPPSNWSERLDKCLGTPSSCGLTEKQRDEIGEHMAATTPKGEKEGLHDPLHAYSTVPSCTATWTVCAEDLEELQLVPERDSLEWKKAVIEKGAAAVLTLSPGTGSEVKTGSKVVVETNPDSGGMPAVIPDPEDHETYSHYIARLNPALDPTRETVSDANEDASAGPDAVLQVSPEPGTRADPATTTAVEVQTNPHDAPVVPLESSGCDASVGSIDFSPLNRGLGNRFPFGLFTWAADWLSEWPDGEEAPSWTLPIVPGGVFGGEGVHLHLAFGWLEPYIEPIRIVMLLATFVGIIWFLATAALKLQGDTS